MGGSSETGREVSVLPVGAVALEAAVERPKVVLGGELVASGVGGDSEVPGLAPVLEAAGAVLGTALGSPDEVSGCQGGDSLPRRWSVEAVETWVTGTEWNVLVARVVACVVGVTGDGVVGAGAVELAQWLSSSQQSTRTW